MNDKKTTVLIVDDDVDLLEQMKQRLLAADYDVIAGGSQEEGEKLIEENDPDVAVFDLMLENHDSGFILSYKMKKKNPDVPVILITGVASETGIEFSTDGGETRSWIKADAILNKSIRFEQLQSEINRLLKDNKSI